MSSIAERKRRNNMKGFYVTPGREEFRREMKRERDRVSNRERARSRPFIAWDGEGLNVGPDGDFRHKYMLMVNSEDDMLESEDGKGIATDEAFQFLLDGAEGNPDAIHVMYGMSYDVNMMLNGVHREVPYGSLQRLVQTHRCTWMDYEIEYVPRRFFRVSQYDSVDSERDGHRTRGRLQRSVSIWDVMQFFQTSFVDALCGMFTEEEMRHYFDIDLIRYMKKRRGVFTIEEFRNGLLADYSMSECKALVELMVRFRRNCHDSGIHLNRYDGAGAGAAALMREHGLGPIVKTATGIIESDINKGLPEAIQVAYGSGHVEMFMSGHTDEEIEHYDMRGSFPSQMPDLVDLSDGIWSHHTFSDELPWLPIFGHDEFALYKVYWDYRDSEFDRMFPFFYRNAAGRIQYPPQGYSWIFSPELKAAMSPVAMEHLKVFPKVLEMWKFTPYSFRKPFAFVKDVYEKRLWYKRQGLDGQAGGLKGSLNAIPGKLAQTVGYYDGGGDRSKRIIPSYFNLAYAGWITSCVRAKVYMAMMQAPYDIVAVATDGIWSYVPLDLPIGENLGQWKHEKLSGFTSVQPGIYFTKQIVQNRKVHHYRGFNDDSISEEKVIEAWLNREYGVRIPTRRFVGMAGLIDKEDYKKNWCTWQDTERVLNIQQGLSTKRIPILYDGEEWPTTRAATNLIETEAAPVPQFEENISKYELEDRWGISIEAYLSRKHHVPWLARSWEVTSEIVEHELDWEIIESEI
jgi:hypothetical protein